MRNLWPDWWSFQDKGIDLNGLLGEFLDQREEKIAEEKAAIVIAHAIHVKVQEKRRAALR